MTFNRAAGRLGRLIENLLVASCVAARIQFDAPWRERRPGRC